LLSVGSWREFVIQQVAGSNPAGGFKWNPCPSLAKLKLGGFPFFSGLDRRGTSLEMRFAFISTTASTQASPG